MSLQQGLKKGLWVLADAGEGGRASPVTWLFGVVERARRSESFCRLLSKARRQPGLCHGHRCANEIRTSENLDPKSLIRAMLIPSPKPLAQHHALRSDSLRGCRHTLAVKGTAVGPMLRLRFAPLLYPSVFCLEGSRWLQEVCKGSVRPVAGA